MFKFCLKSLRHFKKENARSLEEGTFFQMTFAVQKYEVFH